ncbi:MAG: zf-HC2 domain-containing protein [Clostridium sartagoforme]|nr:zf-HC2 domain-containing protein [Clostridium sartagoforme]
MANKLSCNIIKDLLPMYVDEISSEETNNCIKEHFDRCDDCKKEYYKIIKGNSSNEKINNIEIFKKFKFKIMVIFILFIIISIATVSLAMICKNIQLGLHRMSTLEVILFVLLNICIYLMPMMTLLLCWIWKKVSYGSSSYNVANSFFISLVIIVLYLIGSLLYRYMNLVHLL